MPKVTWRKLETVLCEVARKYSLTLDENSDTGDKYIKFEEPFELNLTELDQDLHEELAR